MMRPPRASALLAILVGALLAGCGYSFNAARSEGVRTVSVPIFENGTFMHGLELHLTDAVIKEIQRRTPWVVTTGAADTTLTGAIADARVRTLSTSPRTGLVQEQALELAVDFRWTDARTGRTLIERRNFRGLESFVPERGTNERLELGQHAAVQELAREIVNELRSTW